MTWVAANARGDEQAPSYLGGPCAVAETRLFWTNIYIVLSISFSLSQFENFLMPKMQEKYCNLTNINQLFRKV